MIDLRPVGYVIGLLVAALGLTMLAPFVADLSAGNNQWHVFLEASAITFLAGALTAKACSNGVGQGLSLRQTFLLTVLVWVALPIFGAIPFMLTQLDVNPPFDALPLGSTDRFLPLSFTDAVFEAMSGLTTTGASVISNIEGLPEGLLLWRGILQWLGGIGIIVVAMVFLPELRVGGMQIFRSEGFDTMGKILPRAAEIASRISVIYVSLTLICALSYAATGLDAFDSIVHAMTTVATGGMANFNNSFIGLPPATQYVAVIFMLLAALPFVRYVQLLAGTPDALWKDSQVRGFFVVQICAVLIITLWVLRQTEVPTETAFRESLFNTVSIMTGTGYAGADYMAWGAFAVAFFFLIGLIGGCAGSTACSIKIFRYQLLFASIKVQIQRVHSPHGMFTPRYNGRRVGDDVLDSVMAFFVAFIVVMGLFTVALGLTGEDFITSISGASAALANIGPGLGDKIGPTGNYREVNEVGKWLLIVAMLVGRLEVMAVLTILTARFWRG